ncbi:hypothetical protein H6F74_13290 [Trichocoleus sp. FACHB-90]|uniref:hypothetical protein n=1 Tax=Cyanophyceae TaxID=3028117 RepID=UPI001682E46D|nr:hypothetical protein [Trichocoleus sp. FACHB-90]MBD1927213.1 hypothetical protein [Trichocoleus sp. FACHB-90]
MSSSTNISIKSLTLLVREEKRPPVGVSPAANRDIGFASVFIRLENTKEEDAYLIIKSIQIQNVADGSIEMASKSPQPIHLSPLENSENAFHLANKTGYSGQDKVKAVILYELGDQVQVIESIPVEIKRH